MKRVAAVLLVCVLVAGAAAYWYFRSSRTRLTGLPGPVEAPVLRAVGKLPKAPRSVIVIVEENKGFDEIIRALSIVKKQRDDFHLRIIGYGTKEEAIRHVLEEHDLNHNISILGRVEYTELASYYLSSDCYLFYGDREGSSLAMIEAVSYGLPLIATDHPGNRSYIADGESGYLVEHRNPERLIVIQPSS